MTFDHEIGNTEHFLGSPIDPCFFLMRYRHRRVLPLGLTFGFNVRGLPLGVTLEFTKGFTLGLAIFAARGCSCMVYFSGVLR